MPRVSIDSNRLRISFNKQILKKLNDSGSIPKYSKAVKKPIQDLVKETLKDSDEYKSLTAQIISSGDDLAADFGFYAGSEASIVDPIVNKLVRSVSVRSTRARFKGKRLNFATTVVLYKDNYIDELKGLPTSVIDNDGNAGGQLPWVEWLLERGTELIIIDYDVLYTTNPSRTQNSRSGRAIMIPSQSSWFVNPIYAGTSGNNWITRALDIASNRKFEKALRKILRDNLDIVRT